MSTYVFDQAWQRERERLGALESLFDSTTRRLLSATGLGEGWRCLEVGGGAGGIARWLADRVGDTGRVLATDVDTRFLEGHGLANLDVRTHDIVTDELEESAFDLVHARALLQHLRARDEVLPRLVTAVKPGGWLLVEDVDFGGPAASFLAQHFSPSEGIPASERILAAVAAVFNAIGADPSYGRRLPTALAAAGLVNIAAQVQSPIVAGGEETWTRGTVQQLAERLVSTGLTTADDIELFLRLTESPQTRYAPAFMVSAWGQRP